MSRGRGFFGSLLLLIMSGQLGCLGSVVAIVVLAVLVYIAVQIAYVVGRILLAVGILFGAGITVRNYLLALFHNIKPEKVTP